jgi:hypothetical protein
LRNAACKRDSKTPVTFTCFPVACFEIKTDGMQNMLLLIKLDATSKHHMQVMKGEVDDGEIETILFF